LDEHFCTNGSRSDQRLENLRLLCPNCHALTPTYRGKNMDPNKNGH
jgi:5-methylcytosine-specific restriction endonuclease McrA